MIIIFGTKGRKIKLDENTFFCPSCVSEVTYTRYKVGNYFTLFFIPLFPISKSTQLIECQTCHSQYMPSVLDLPASEIYTQIAYKDALSGTPLQMVQKKLLNRGLSEEEAESSVNHLRNKCHVQLCSQCDMHYLQEAELTACTACGSDLR